MSDTNLLNLQPDDPKFREILSRHKVLKISVFGSHALGEATKDSDIDFLVEFGRGADLFDQVGLKLDLEELLGRKVDIATPNSLSIYIRERILDQAVPVWRGFGVWSEADCLN